MTTPPGAIDALIQERAVEDCAGVTGVDADPAAQSPVGTHVERRAFAQVDVNAGSH